MGELENFPPGQRWDVFISHASEDKEIVARPLAKALASFGLRVWFDEQALHAGDSLRRKIDEGLGLCRYGIVILSPSFFQKEWPQRELDGLTAREISGHKVILPIWHQVTFDTIVRYSPMMAGRLAPNTDKGLEPVVSAVLEAIAFDNKHGPEKERSSANRELTQREKKASPIVVSLKSTMRRILERQIASKSEEEKAAVEVEELKKTSGFVAVMAAIEGAIARCDFARADELTDALRKKYPNDPTLIEIKSFLSEHSTSVLSRNEAPLHAKTIAYLQTLQEQLTAVSTLETIKMEKDCLSKRLKQASDIERGRYEVVRHEEFRLQLAALVKLGSLLPESSGKQISQLEQMAMNLLIKGIRWYPEEAPVWRQRVQKWIDKQATGWPTLKDLAEKMHRDSQEAFQKGTSDLEDCEHICQSLDRFQEEGSIVALYGWIGGVLRFMEQTNDKSVAKGSVMVGSLMNFVKKSNEMNSQIKENLETKLNLLRASQKKDNP
jgi:hypothetical protein